MEKQLNSDIEVIVKFKGITSVEDLPDFEFAFYTELNQSTTYACSKEGWQLVNCAIKEAQNPPKPYVEVKCMLENHNLKSGRLCVLAHIKWTDPDYEDGVRNDVYRQKLDLHIEN
jgi:hypothetical protein